MEDNRDGGREPADSAPPTAPDWSRMHLWQIQPVRDLLVVACLLLLFYLGYVLSAITVPILLALALAYLFEPIICRLTATGRVSRPAASGAVIAGAVLVIIVPLAFGSVFAVVQAAEGAGQVRLYVRDVQTYLKQPESEAGETSLNRLPRGWQWIARQLEQMDGDAPPAPSGDGVRLPDLVNKTSLTEEDSGEATTVVDEPPEGAGIAERFAHAVSLWLDQNSTTVGGIVSKGVLGTGRDAIRILVGAVTKSFYLGFATFLTLFFFFFFSTSYGRVKANFASLIPKWKRERVLENLRQMDLVIAGFVRGRLIIAGILMVMYSIGFVVIGVPGGLILGLGIGVASLVPYLALMGVPVAVLLLWMHPSDITWQNEWWWVIGAPCITYFIIQATDDYLWTPLIQGKTTQLDTPSILFAVIAGGILAGFYGVLVAIPAAACLKILLRESIWPRFRAWSDGKVRDFLPISRYDPTSASQDPPQGP